MNNGQSIIKYVKGFHSRMKDGYMLKQVTVALTVGLFGASIVAAAALVWPIYYSLYIEAGILILALILGMILGIRKAPDETSATLVIDSFGLKERVTTAFFTLKGKKSDEDSEFSEIEEMQIEDAERELQSKKNEIRVPRFINWRHIAVFAVAVIVAVVLTLTPAESKEIAKEKHETREEAKEKMKEIEEAMKTLENIDQTELSDEQKQKMAQMMEQLQASYDEMNKAKTQSELASADQKLQFRYEDIVSNLDEMAEMTMNEKASNGDASVASDMQDASQKIGQNIQNPNATASNQNGQNGNQNGQNGQNGNQNGQNGNQNGNGNGNGNQNGNGNGEGNGEGNGKGEGEGSGEGKGKGEGGGNGNGGHGRSETGVGTDQRDYVSLPNATGDDDNLTGQKTGDDSNYAKYENGLGWEGNKTDYGSVMKEYQQRAYQDIEQGKYPAGMEDIIKDYFSDFE